MSSRPTLCAAALALLAALGAGDASAAASPWRRAREEYLAPAATQRVLTSPRYQTVWLDRAALLRVLDRAPLEFTKAARTRTVELSLPMPDGAFQRFRIEESPVLEPALARKFPRIRTYRGQGLDDATATVRFDWTPRGFHAMVLRAGDTVFIDPWAKGNTRHYVSYFKKDYRRSTPPDFRCEVTGDDLTQELRRVFGPPQTAGPFGSTLRTYSLALAGTGEYTTAVCAPSGPGVSCGLAAMAITLNRVNGIYERDVAVHMNLVANNDQLVYTNGSTDPYTNDNGFTMLGENQSNVDSVIGSANYDIGHVFSTGGGGVAGLGVVCISNQKARGVTGSTSPEGDGFDIDYVAHEMGHQFDANHTFNGTTDACGGGNRNGSTAYEPGSGSTIMAYAGICGAEDVQGQQPSGGFSDDDFHAISLDEVQGFISAGDHTCDTEAATGNTTPTVDAGANFTIPIGTPFTLTASGSDADGDSVTYDWDEMDLGTASPPSSDNGNRPLFRSFVPTSSPTRTFPRLSTILAGTTPTFPETLPATNRTMTFRVSIRDNRSGAGGTNSDTMTVTSTTSSGPFAVTAPNTAVTWAGGSMQTVTWNVASTTSAPVSCANVNILLSTDGGTTFGTTILAGTPNDGTQSITVPNIATTEGRIKVECAGNIFFDIGNADFTITAAAQPSVSIDDATPVTEGNAGTTNAVFTVTVSGTVTSDVVVSYSTSDGTATQPADYQLTSGALTFTSVSTAAVTIAVPVVGDQVDEPNETFDLDISVTSGNATVSDGTGVGTINDDEATPQISVGDTIMAEGDGAGTALVSVGMFPASSGTVTVAYATSDGTATAGADYTGTTGVLTFTSGSTGLAISVGVLGDTMDENDETLNVTLGTVTGTATVADGSGLVTLTDDDSPPSLSLNDPTALEGDEGTTNADFVISLSSPSGKTITVDYGTADGTATAPDDYTTTSGTATITPGAATWPIPVPVKGDLALEPDHDFTLTISNAQNASIADNQGTATIQDDDAFPAASVVDASVTEGSGGSTNLVLTVELAFASGPDVNVDFATADGTARAGSDYTAVSGTLTFTGGSTSETISVPITTDTRMEPNEAFRLTLSNPVNAKLGRKTGQGVLFDDDRASPDPCNPVATVPITLASPGLYCLTGTLETSKAAGAGVTIAADDVTLDLKGFTIRGTAGLATTAEGVYANSRRRATIRNGTLEGFFRAVHLEDPGPFTLASGHKVQTVTALRSTYAGFVLDGTGNVVIGSQVRETQGTTSFGPNADAFGIRITGASARISGNLVHDTRGQGTGAGYAINVLNGNGANVTRNSVGSSSAGATTGILFDASTGVSATNNKLTTLAFGIVFANGATGTTSGNLFVGVTTPQVGP